MKLESYTGQLAIHARWPPRTLSGVKEGLVEDGRGERTFEFAIHF